MRWRAARRLVSLVSTIRFAKRRGVDMADFGGTETGADSIVAPQSLTQTTREKLRQLVARIEKLEEEKKGLGDDIKESYAEAKAVGFDTKVLRQVIRLRKQDRQEREEQEQVRELYLHALGEI
jgi:uncharacterized protein (UPF0335 family)